MEERLTEAAEELLGYLGEDPTYASDELVTFARRFAFDPDMRTEALVIRAEQLRPKRPERAEALVGEMRALVERIIANHREASAADREAQAKTQEFQKSFKLDSQQSVSETPPALVARNLHKAFPTAKFRLRVPELDLRYGEITGVVGENANGKTTLFRLIVGELRQDQGTLAYPALGAPDPSRVNWSEVKSQIAYVPQSLGKWYGALEDNLRYAAAIKGIRGKDNDRAFTYITARLGIGDRMQQRWSELSGGFKLRFELARALIWRPRLLALDEPLANLDFKAQLSLLRDIRNLTNSQNSPMSVLLSSQHLHEVEAVADKILFLTRGKVMHYGPKDQIAEKRRSNAFELDCSDSSLNLRNKLKHPAIQRVYFNGISYVVVADREFGRDALFDLLRQEGVDVKYFRDISGSVKQLFELEAPEEADEADI